MSVFSFKTRYVEKVERIIDLSENNKYVEKLTANFPLHENKRYDDSD